MEHFQTQYVNCAGGSPPRVRAYLYGTLLYYLQIAQKPKPINTSVSRKLFVGLYLKCGIWNYVCKDTNVIGKLVSRTS